MERRTHNLYPCSEHLPGLLGNQAFFFPFCFVLNSLFKDPAFSLQSPSSALSGKKGLRHSNTVQYMKGHMLKSKEFRATGKFALKFALRVSTLSVCKKVRSYLVLCLIARESGLICLTSHKPCRTKLWDKLILIETVIQEAVLPSHMQIWWPLGRHGHSNPLPPFDFVSASLRALQNFNPVHSEILLSQRFFCRPLLLPPCTVLVKLQIHLFLFQTWSHSRSNKSFLRQNSSTLATYG